MNCRQGDLAVIVRSPSGKNLGRLVTVSSYYGETEVGPAWICESVGAPLDARYSNGRVAAARVFYGPDAWLRPIRPGDTSDAEESHKEKEVA